MENTDITIIGAGVVGLAVAYKLCDANKNIIVIERNDSFGRKTSLRNSKNVLNLINKTKILSQI